MSKLYDTLKRLAGRGDRVVLGTVSSYVGDQRYIVSVGGRSEQVPMVGGASAQDGEAVALLINGETGQVIGALGVVRDAAGQNEP